MTDTSDTSTLLSSEPAPQAVPGQSPAPDTVSALAPNGGATPEPATGAGDSAQETKPATAPAPVVPESYEFTAPEGMELDAVAVEAFTPIAKELGLNQAQAQKLADLYAGQVGRVMAQVQEAQAAQEAAWVSEIKADPEIGGAKLEGNLSVAAKAIDAFGGADLRQALTITGAGNHPAIVRAFVEIGKAISEDNFIRSNGADPGGRSAAETLYPSQTKGN